jgi:hypothetical protein
MGQTRQSDRSPTTSALARYADNFSAGWTGVIAQQCEAFHIFTLLY